MQRVLFPAILLLAQITALPASTLEPQFGPASLPRKVFLQPLLASDDADNDVDRWLLDIARSDGAPNVLDALDFVRAVPDATVDAFLAAANRYVNARWIRGDRANAVVAAFLDEVAHLNLPPRYTVFLLYGSADIGRLRRGHLVGNVRAGKVSASNVIQGHAIDWAMTGWGIGGESLWPWQSDPYQARWPLAYLGLGMEASHATGTVTHLGTSIADTNLFALTFLIAAHLRLTLNPTWLVKGSVGTGFGLGTLKVVRRNPDDTNGLQDPCKLDPEAGLDLNAASAAVRCTITNSFGFFQSYPVIFSGGVEVWGWLHLDATYQYASLVTDKVQFAPPGIHELSLRLGVNIY